MQLPITDTLAAKIAQYLYEVDADLVKRGRSELEVGHHLFAALHWASEGKEPTEAAWEIITAQRDRHR